MDTLFNIMTALLFFALFTAPIWVIVFVIYILIAKKPVVPQSPSVRWGKREVKVRDDYRVQDVGWLLDELHFGNRHTRPLTYTALTDVLPKLKPHDAQRLTAHHHSILDTLLDGFVSVGKISSQEAVLCLAILKAMENIGEAGDEWHVQHLALSARLPQIREAALAALPLLQARITKTHIAQSLLRASQPPISSDNLLRPVLEQEDTQVETLLRPR